MIPYSTTFNFRGSCDSCPINAVFVQGLALSKLEEWIENTASSFIMYRFNAELRTVHRRRIAFQAECLNVYYSLHLDFTLKRS
jgi:hypothetical protein